MNSQPATITVQEKSEQVHHSKKDPAVGHLLAFCQQMSQIW